MKDPTTKFNILCVLFQSVCMHEIQERSLDVKNFIMHMHAQMLNQGIKVQSTPNLHLCFKSCLLLFKLDS